MTMTRREYAASLGLAIAGARGKLSRDAHEAIAKAETEGMVFTDTQYTINLKRKDEPKPVKVTPARDADVLTVVRTYPTDTVWVGKDSKGTTVSANYKQICNNCKVSLAGHDCVNPSTLTATYSSGRICGESIRLEVKS